MVNIHSSIGSNKQRSGSGQQQSNRNWSIPDGQDDTENYANIPNDFTQQPTRQMINPAEVAHRRQIAMEKSEQQEQKSSKEAMRRVDFITGIGRKTKEVPITDDSTTTVFTLRSLKSFEQNCYAQAVEQAERIVLSDGRTTFKPTSLYNMKLVALSYSLFMIDGQLADLVLGTFDLSYEEQIEAKKSLISEMDGALIDHLFNKFDELSTEVYDGYIPKTQEQVKEVIQAINKSS
jgi:hypothetical protein